MERPTAFTKILKQSKYEKPTFKKPVRTPQEIFNCSRRMLFVLCKKKIVMPWPAPLVMPQEIFNCSRRMLFVLCKKKIVMPWPAPLVMQEPYPEEVRQTEHVSNKGWTTQRKQQPTPTFKKPLKKRKEMRQTEHVSNKG